MTKLRSRAGWQPKLQAQEERHNGQLLVEDPLGFFVCFS
jgi:hypothetical protein